MYIGDFRLNDTFDVKFCTVQATGAPTTLAGSPVISAYPGNTTTELTAGITLSVDFDARTGMHNVRVAATSGNGYATATNYALVITTGTVNSVSVVGYVIGHFSIENRSALMPTTAARTLVVDAAGLADANMVKAGPSGSGTAQTAKDIGGAVPAAAAGASGGLLISGSNSGTTTLAALTVTGATTLSDGLLVNRSTSNASAIVATGNGTGHGISAVSGSGATGNGINASSGATNGHGLNAAGAGTGDGLKSTGGATGHAFELVGGGTSGDGLKVTTTSGHGFNIAATGTSKHGITATGGNAGTSDGIVAAAGTGGVDLRANQTGNLTGNVSGSVGSVTGAVGSVTGAVGSVTGNVGGNVTGSVGSVVGAVGSVTGAVGSVTGAVGSVTGAVGSVTGNVGGNVTGSVGSVATGGIAAASFAAGAIDAAAIAADAIGSSEIAATAATEIANAVAAIAMADPSAVPAVTATLQQTLSWLLALSRNLVTQTATQQKVFQDDGTTLVATSTHSDDGTTHTRGEWA